MSNVNCLRCNFRHEDNGNCTAVGGFCTAVPASRCPLLRQYLDTGLTPEEVTALQKTRVTYARWIYDMKVQRPYCSACREYFYGATNSPMSYCSNCGAKMNGGTENA